jgi:putative transposase
MILAHKIALAPNTVQRTYFARAAGTARFAYNWALAEWKRQYEAHKADATQPKPSQLSLRRQLNALKADRFPWMLEVTKNAPQMAIIQLGTAFTNFFAGRCAYPKPRKKGLHDRFSLTNDQFTVTGKRVRIPGLGWVRMREILRFSGKIMSATVSREADRWFISVSVETTEEPKRPAENQGEVGVDLGVSTLATLSTGETLAGPKPHRALHKRLVRLSRSLGRKAKGGANRRKAQRKLARLHARIGHIRSDCLHKLTSELTRRFTAVGLEDLNVSGMLANRHLSRSVADMGFFEFRRQLVYKAIRRNRTVVFADRWFPSSKRCSACAFVVTELPLAVRSWSCPQCHAVHDRDVNAALNLRPSVLSLAVSSTVSACRGVGSGQRLKPLTKPAPTTQEVSPEHGRSQVTMFG